MSRLFFGNLDVTKIDKSKLFKGKKGTYLDLTIWLNDEPDQYGNTLSIQQSVSKEERENGVKATYLGNLKEFVTEQPEDEGRPAEEVGADDDDLPF